MAARRSEDGTVVAELALPSEIDRPWHPDPTAPTRFVVLSSRAKGGRTELTFRVSWVAGAKPSARYERYVEDILKDLQGSIVDVCSRPPTR